MIGADEVARSNFAMPVPRFIGSEALAARSPQRERKSVLGVRDPLDAEVQK
jgi:hypothetical protein